ncbi:error-prone DNA polymerase [Microbacterium sp. YY-01]|uniref:error-prone DNA polymerase n=1 Tax=Microbacterium sp. YY-01 TaxID=3421634 RepID=UPI003D17B30D
MGGWNNPPLPWSTVERLLSGRESSFAEREESSEFLLCRNQAESFSSVGREDSTTADEATYAELHAHSSFSFLDGVSSPEALVREAERQGLSALALTDHDGFYGAVQFAEAAEQSPVRTIFGAELSLDLSAPQNGVADPEGEHLLVLARGHEGYHRLASAITRAHLRGKEKGRPVYDRDDLAASADGHWMILTGCRKGAVRRGLRRGNAQQPLRHLVDLFGRDNVVVELIDHGNPLDTVHNDALAELAHQHRLPVVATNNVHYATPSEASQAELVAAIRATRSMNELDGWLPAHGSAHIRSGAEMAARFWRYPEAIRHTLRVAEECAFPLRLARPQLPQMKVPSGHSPMSYLRFLVWQAVPHKYPKLSAEARSRIERELAVIEEKDFPGYFLIVHDIVREARRRNILCQGRGSAAASAVCFLLNITAIDPIFYDLPFERFLATTREEEPDIDVDFDSDRREEIIQWVYHTYGRDRAAQVANIIQYRPKNAVRDVARALGFSAGQQDSWSRQIERHTGLKEASGEHDIPAQVTAYASALLKTPRHLGIHSGGMVLTRRPVGEVVPVEHARMQGRTVIQWDKDDAAWMGLVKFDLLGLGMLAAVQHCCDMIAASTGEKWTLESIPKEEAGVYDMLCRADAIGVFQVESRAQLSLLPRLRPRSFYDLAIQIALIRPGPIQGGAVHPFVRRKLGQEKVTYVHPLVEPILARTLGVPVFQEQLIRMATVLGDCTADEADLLRRAMGSRRGHERIEKIRVSLYAGMRRNGLSDETADRVYAQIQAFSHFGFAESHSLSFALLVYASSWLKLHYPAAFLAALLRSQPMGFYSSATLVADARRHGVQALRPDLHTSAVHTDLEPLAESACATGRDECVGYEQHPVPPYDPDAAADSATHRRDGHYAVRLGLTEVAGVSEQVAARIVSERQHGGPYRDLHDLVRRTGITEEHVAALAEAGACESLGLNRREALWQAGTAAQDRPERLEGTVMAVQPPLFTDQSILDELVSDLQATGMSTTDHPLAHARASLQQRGVLSTQQLALHEPGRRVEVAGVVTHRQRPSTAGGITFLNLEDEFGMVNVVCSPGLWSRYRRIARESSALRVRGILQRSAEGVIALVADALDDLPLGVPHISRDFR